MNDLRTAAQQALEAIDRALPHAPHRGEFDALADMADALRAALAEPPTNQCGETCERAKLCAVCARGVAEPVQEPLSVDIVDTLDALRDERHPMFVEGYDYAVHVVQCVIAKREGRAQP